MRCRRTRVHGPETGLALPRLDQLLATASVAPVVNQVQFSSYQ
jgi:hypothetical protein